LLLLLPFACFAALRMPLTYPEGDFILNVMDVVHTGHVSSTFTPDTYPYLVGMLDRVGGARLVVLSQAGLYLLLALWVYGLLRVLEVGRRMSFLAALVIALDPDLLSSISKIWDTEITCLLLVVLAAGCVRMLRALLEAHTTSLGWIAGLGCLWGFGMTIRPNFALLALPILYVLWNVLQAEGRRAWLIRVGTGIVCAVAVFAGMNTLAHGSFYVAQNGPYNFFAGANAHTDKALREFYNAESSVPLALADLGVHLGAPVGANADPAYDLTLRPLYMHEGFVFLREHPLDWLWLGGVKLVTLLRPDNKAHATRTPAGMMKGLTSLCVVVWAGAWMVARVRGYAVDKADVVVLITMGAYVLPFLLTNADPRFRVPLDVVLLAHAGALMARRLAVGAAHGERLVSATL
jgi:hypothetical protein